MKDNELNVYYKIPAKGIDVKLDQAIEKTLKKLGWTRWASGFSPATGTRDLSFQVKKKRSEKCKK